MSVWRSHTYRRAGQEKGIDPTVLRHAISIGSAITEIDRKLPVILSLKHLAYLTDTDYGFLRAVVSRELDAYKIFRIRKRSGPLQHKRFRLICVPDSDLMCVHRWINQRILSRAKSHEASVAYAKHSNIYEAAQMHCGSRWMLKLDVVNFFESISEIRVYHVFRKFGYEPLVAFEMTRLCTRQGAPTPSRLQKRWLSHGLRRYRIRNYRFPWMGHLPQGAPTSPMLANLAVRELDDKLSKIARHDHLVYTRYADDLTFSSEEEQFGRSRLVAVVRKVYAAMASVGLSPNKTKTKIITPGARKIVLGLLVDGDKPRLPRPFKANLRRHIYYLLRPDVGPAHHAARRGFVSVVGLRNHIRGLIGFARQVEPDYARSCADKLSAVRWPL